MRKEQKLVNAQVHINRAVWAMNTKESELLAEADISEKDQYILMQIDGAICELKEARKGYGRQPRQRGERA